MLATCTDARIDEPAIAATILLKSMAGVMQGVLEQGGEGDLAGNARAQLAMLGAAYLERLAVPRA